MAEALPPGTRLIADDLGVRYRTSDGAWFAVSGSGGRGPGEDPELIGMLRDGSGPRHSALAAEFAAVERRRCGDAGPPAEVDVLGTGLLADALRNLSGLVLGAVPVVIAASDDAPIAEWAEWDGRMLREPDVLWARAHVSGRYCLLEPVSRGVHGVGHLDVSRRLSAAARHPELEARPATLRGSTLMDEPRAVFCAARLIALIGAAPDEPPDPGHLERIDLLTMRVTSHPVLAVPGHEPLGGW